MTPTELEQVVRRRYNSISDDFWAQAEIFELFYNASLELAIETQCIQRIYTTTTVAGTQGYAFPTNVMSIKRVTYDNKKLKPINMREDDAITGLNQAVTTQAAPNYYWQWNYTVNLRPIPDSALTLQLWTVNAPSQISSTSVLEIPAEFHLKLANFVIAEMAAKDSNATAAGYYMQRWEKDKMDVKKWMAMRKRSDGFGNVMDEEQTVGSYLGIV